jgi:uncharacterized SAM-binding protein YcdF (DUF218 family)
VGAPTAAILAQLVHPVTLTLAALGVAMILLGRHRRRAALTVLVLALIWTWGIATPAAARWLRGSLEARFDPALPSERPTAAAIVVLGGGIAPQAPPRAGANLTAAGDRLWYGAQLYRADKAPRLITTGANPYPGDGPTAAQAGAQRLAALGVPRTRITAASSTNTYTDALAVRRLMAERGDEPVLLVTSAIHTPRARATFRAAGIRALPAPTDFVVTAQLPAGTYAWLLSAAALHHSGQAMREYMGLLYYRLRGWL